MLLNLLGNAGKFTEQGKVTLEAFREPGIGKDLMVFRVTDTGLGMSPEELTELFEAFAQIDSCSTKRHGGTGLGLAISRRLCRLMGGDIGVRSIKGEGSTFTATCAFTDPGMRS